MRSFSLHYYKQEHTIEVTFLTIHAIDSHPYRCYAFLYSCAYNEAQASRKERPCGIRNWKDDRKTNPRRELRRAAPFLYMSLAHPYTHASTTTPTTRKSSAAIPCPSPTSISTCSTRTSARWLPGLAGSGYALLPNRCAASPSSGASSRPTRVFRASCATLPRRPFTWPRRDSTTCLSATPPGTSRTSLPSPGPWQQAHISR